MKKILFVLLTLCATLSLFALNTVKAEESAPSTSDWMPHRYMLSGYEIPTVMTYDETSVTFSGSLNAGIATTGFNYLKPVDLNNFSIEMDLDIPDIDHLTWLCVTFLDTCLIKDAENSTAPVAMPFNAMSGEGGWQNTKQKGLVLQLWTQALVSDQVFGFSYVSKGVNFETGEATNSGWTDYTNNSFVNSIKLDNEFDGKFKLDIHSTEEGLAFNLNDGAWKYQDEEGAYTQTRDSLAYNNTLGLKEYFKDKDCYMALELMYKDEIHRTVNLKVNKINGLNPSDNKTPSYLEPKEIEKDGIKATIPTNAVGVFGVYPSAIDGLKVVKYDEEDGDYEVVSKRATSLNGTLIDYFRVVPQIGTTNVVLQNPMTVEYTLPGTYDSYKAYFINDDDETQSFPNSYVSIENNKMTLKVDNDVINKIAIYGLMDEKPVDETPKENDTNDSSSTTKKGCKGTISISILSIGIILTTTVICAKRKRDE